MVKKSKQKTSTKKKVDNKVKNSSDEKLSSETENKVSKTNDNNKNNKNEVNSSMKSFAKDEISFDRDSAVKLVKTLLPVVFIIFVMWFAFFVRSGPIDLDGLDNNIRSNIYSQIQNGIAMQVANQYPKLSDFDKQELVQKEYQKVLESGTYQMGGQTISIEDIVNSNTEGVKQMFKAENGQTYLNAIDPYHYIRLATNYQLNGHTGIMLKDVDGKEVSWDNKKLAPVGIPGVEDPEFHIWLEAFLFDVNGLDENSTIGERTAAIYLIPVVLAMLAVIPCFLILRRFSNDLFALFGSLLLVSIGTFVSRTVAGFVDTDGYNVLFPLIIVAFLLYGFVYRNVGVTVGLGLVAGFFQGLFLWAWDSGWFMFLFSMGSLIAYLGYIFLLDFFKEFKFTKFSDKFLNALILLVSFAVSASIFTWYYIGRDIFSYTYESIFSRLAGLGTISNYIWPNVLSSVAELNAASFGSIIGSVGGKVIFLIALLGLVMLALDFKARNSSENLYSKIVLGFAIFWFLIIIFGGSFVSLTANSQELFMVILFLPVALALIMSFINNNTSDKVFLSILLSMWMAGTIYMSLNGVRFILLLAPAFAVSYGIGLYYISNMINKFFISEFKARDDIKKNLAGFTLVSIVFVVLFIPIYTQANGVSNGTVPNFDDAWYSSMAKIKANSSESAIITSWWDFGHFFITVSDRGATFDGASQATPRSHWVGRLLMENEEEISLDILRMLTCGGNGAYDIMYEKVGKDNSDAVKINKIIYSTFSKDINETREILLNNPYYDFSFGDVDDIMPSLKCEEPVENFVIASEDMVGKAGVWAHWGSWNFTRKYVHDNYKTMSTEEIAAKLDEDVVVISKLVKELKNIEVRVVSENVKRESLLNQWLAPYPSYVPLQGRYEYPCVASNTSLTCQNSIVIDLLNGKVSSGFGDNVKFNRVVYPSQGNKMAVMEVDESGDMDILLIPGAQGTYNVMLMQYPLAGSLFTKLFYLNGFGTEHFVPFDEQNSGTGVNIKVWKTQWEVEESESDILSNLLSGLELDNIQQNSNQTFKINMSEEEVEEL
ncbi:MAG: hypothetical protein KC589_08090, partial [Nanoarchaeota archaeon]|nr:hypothetical protein [Nanoarchaeota archaeon]